MPLYGGLLDGLIDSKTDAQIRRKVDECCTVERNTEALESMMHSLDQSGDPALALIDDLVGDCIPAVATAVTIWERNKFLGERPKMMAGRQERKCDRLRRKLVNSLRLSHPELSFDERTEKAESLTDDQLIAAVQKVHQKVTGAMLAVGADVSEWLSSIWTWILANWKTILSVLVGLLVFI